MRIEKGKLDTPYRDLLYGTSGIGKTTYASLTDRAVFLATEQGTDELDISRLRRDDGGALEKYEDARDAIKWLGDNDHPFTTLVIDTVDWLDHWVQTWICDKNDWTSIETPGYGKGFVASAEEWRNVLHSLEVLQRKRRMNILLLGHAHVKRVSPPDLEPYDRYGLKVPESTAALIYEWCGHVMFAQQEVVVEKREGETKQRRGFDTGRRILHTVETASVKAKNRCCLPSPIVFDRGSFAEIQRHRTANPHEILEQIFKESPKAKEKEKETREWFEKAPDKMFAVQRLRARLAEGEGAKS